MLKNIGIGMIKIYRGLFFLRYFFSVQHGGPCCRFHPTCSKYTMQAIKKFGLLKGMILGAKRLLRCHPFGQASLEEDPVPESFDLIKRKMTKHHAK